MQKINYIIILTVTALFACNSKPKVIEPESQSQNAPIFQESTPPSTAVSDVNNEEHKVVALEALNTDKYTYVRVNENGQENWIAITKRDIKVGNTYYYRGGLMKKNFQSKEFNRVFETVYLVGDFREEGQTTNATPAASIPAETKSLEAPKNVKLAAGAIRIADLVANKTKYEGKVVKITGKCVKLNPMIMGRNWVHINDGSGKNLEITVTTSETVQLGSMVTLEGTLALNKDFGAGYKYDYIIEGAKLSN